MSLAGWSALAIVAALGARAAVVALRPHGVGGCHRGLATYRVAGDINGSVAISSLAASTDGSDRVFVTTADARMYVGETGGRERFRWRRIATRAPGRLYAASGSTPTLLAGFDAVYRSADGGRSWRQISCGLLVNDVAATPDLRTIYVVADDAEGTDRGGGLYRSTNGGRSWRRFIHFPHSDQYDFMVGDVSFNPSEPRQLAIAPTSGGVELSDHGGGARRFTSISKPDLGLFGLPAAVAYGHGPSPALWAASNRDVYAEPARLRWRRVLARPNAIFGSVLIDPRSVRVVFVVDRDNGVVWRTADEGAHWRPVRALPRPIQGLLAQSSSGRLYAYGARSVYVSSDDGRSWKRLPDLPDAPRGWKAIYQDWADDGRIEGHYRCADAITAGRHRAPNQYARATARETINAYARRICSRPTTWP
jgi:hypothetical protein